MFPARLKPGDEIRVVSPAVSLAVITPELRQNAVQRLESLGLRVTFSDNAEECDVFNSSAVASRVADLHDAFTDPSVKGILTTLGGYNSNQLLRHLDYDLIAANPKIFCGYSDITALSNAFYARAGLVTYSGPHFSSFGMLKGFDYILESFKACLMQAEPFELRPAEFWSDEAWYRDQQNRVFRRSPGWVVVNPGQAQGRIVGGNLCTFNLLHGTDYMPSLEGSLLLVEDDEESHIRTFDRDLQSLIHQPGFEGVRGLLIGRFQNASKVALADLITLLRAKPELNHIPVVVNADFGHTTPFFTFPIGGTATLNAVEGAASLTITEH